MLNIKNYSFRFLLTSLFTILLVSVGSIIGIISYTQIEDMLLSAADKNYKEITEKTVLRYGTTKHTVFNILKLLSHTSLSSSNSIDQRLEHLMVLSTAINAEKSITGIQLGYANGDFFNLIKLNKSTLKQHFKAPNDATLMVDNIQKSNTGSSPLNRLFFDKDLKLIKKIKPYNTNFDPRERPWFIQAKTTPVFTQPYYFYFTHKVGITSTIKMHQTQTVMALDISLENISASLENLDIPENSKLFLITSNAAVIARTDDSKNSPRVIDSDFNEKIKLPNISELNSELLNHFPQKDLLKQQPLNFDLNGIAWSGAVKKIGLLGSSDLYLLLFTPVKELLKEATNIGWMHLYLLCAIIFITLPIIWIISKRISISLDLLSNNAMQIMHFNFNETPPLKSHIQEVIDLDNAQTLMKSSLSQFIRLINSLAVERDFNSMLEKITIETLNTSKADLVATYLLDEQLERLNVNAIKNRHNLPIEPSCLPDFSFSKDSELKALMKKHKYNHFQFNTQNNTAWNAFEKALNEKNIHLIIMPLINRQSEFMGMVVLAYTQDHKLSEKHQHSLAFVRAFSEFAAVSLESKHLLKMQENLLDAFIKLIAGAIDAKSPYTGGHCQRVPVITKMLAQAACDSNDPLFTNYQLSPDEWQEIHIASWLHDCGKVTTPEFVVDKSTKLETIYNRIHEIRTRFEVLKRDAEIDYWKSLSKAQEKTAAKKIFNKKIQQLDDDFYFVANCNLGGESMQQDKIERLNAIANITWLRTLDKYAGISWEEKQRLDKIPAQELPVEETLLSDNIGHLIERDKADCMPKNNPWGFKLSPPKYKYNLGELYNLSIKYGTLSAEERFIINGHMVQTIKMLEQLPYPSHLKNVPLIAGCHHETMDGKGYPKRLTKQDMPLTARMMAIADIFEALTASDRPYKKAKPLSETIKIMHIMRKNNHIDSDLFELFLKSGVYMDYANKYLTKQQIDPVNIQQYLLQI